MRHPPLEEQVFGLAVGHGNLLIASAKIASYNLASLGSFLPSPGRLRNQSTKSQGADTVNLISQSKTRKGNMIDHVILTSQRLQAFSRFYAQAMNHLGSTTLSRLEGKDGHPNLKGFGIGKSHFFCLKKGKPDPQARSRRICRQDHSEVGCILQGRFSSWRRVRPPQAPSRIRILAIMPTWVLDPDGHDMNGRE